MIIEADLPVSKKKNPKAVVFCSWDDAPHLTEKMKEQQLAGMHPSLRDARTRGIPFLGDGAIYPVPTDAIEVSPFAIPAHWPRGFGMDVGWGRTAAIWGAHDKDSDIVYLYDEHYGSEETPAVHAHSIIGADAFGNNRGKWIPGFIDPAAKGRSQIDGRRLLDSYRSLGLNLELADNAVQAGIDAVWIRLSSGRLKVFSSLRNFWKEYLLYRWDKDHKVIKKNDHIMDSGRYLILSGISKMKAPPAQERGIQMLPMSSGSNAWMGL